MSKTKEEAERQRGREAENRGTYTLVTRSAEETMALGRQLGALLAGGDVVALCGQLGAGKTTFTKGLAQGLGLTDSREVKSPTFVLVKEYAGCWPIAHVDLYRVETLGEAERLDLQVYFGRDIVCVIEWAEKFPELLPPDYLRLLFAHRAPACAAPEKRHVGAAGRPTEREITIEPHGARAAEMLRHLVQRRRETAATS